MRHAAWKRSMAILKGTDREVNKKTRILATEKGSKLHEAK